MKKDYCKLPPELSSREEIDRVEAQWTEIWENVWEHPEKLMQGLQKREELRWMMPFLDRLEPSSRLLDGGCGMGEWTAHFQQHGFQVKKIRPIHRVQGVQNWLEQDIKMHRSDSFLFKCMRRIASRVLPSSYISHMLFAVAQKPADDQARVL